MADENLKQLKAGILQAMKAEKEGQYFYLMAAKSTDDPKGQDVFNRLAAEEAEHYGYLNGHYESLLSTGRIDSSLKLSAPLVLSGASPIFSAALKARIKDAHYEMTALSVAIQLEADAQKFYKEQAKLAEDVAVKSLYLELAAWENSHYNALVNQADDLKEDYWQSAGFAPF